MTAVHDVALVGRDLVGRDKEFAALRASIAAVRAGRGGVVWISGGPGAGKTALLTAVVMGATSMGSEADRPCQVLHSRAAPGGRQPFGALGAALGISVDADPRLARLAGALNDLSGSVAPTQALHAAAERLVELVELHSRVQPLVLAIDDLHVIDDITALAWRRLARGTQRLPLLLIGAGRPVSQSLDRIDPRLAVVASGGLVLELGPLTREQAATLAGRLAGGRPGQALRRLAEAGSAPGHVTDLIEALRDTGRLRLVDGVADVVPDDSDELPVLAQEAFGERLADLPADALDTLRLAAILGQDFSVTDLAALARQSVTELVAPLAAATDAGVLTESGARLAFTHDLIRQWLLGRLPDAERREAFASAPRLLAAAGVPTPRVAEQLAVTAVAGVRCDSWALDWLAARAEQLAFRLPGLVAQVVPWAAAGRPVSDPQVERLLAAQCLALCMQDAWEDSALVARQLLNTARNPVCRAQAAWCLGRALLEQQRYAHAQAVIDAEQGTDNLDSIWGLRLGALRGALRLALGEHGVALSVAQGVRQAAAAAGDVFASGYAGHVSASALLCLGRHQEALGAVEAAILVLGADRGTPDLRLRLAADRVLALAHLGRTEQARRVAVEASRAAEQTGPPGRLRVLRRLTAELDFSLGRWDDALAELECLDLLAAPQLDWWQRQRIAGLVALIAAHRGERVALGTAMHELGRLIPANDAAGGPTDSSLGHYAYGQWARAIVAEQAGRLDQAIALLRIVLSDEWIDRPGHPEDTRRLWWFPRLVRVSLAASDTALAEHCAELAEAEAADEAGGRHAVARLCRGMVDSDVDVLLAAARAFADAPAPLCSGVAYEHAAEALARQGDIPQARAQLLAAVQEYAVPRAGWNARRAQERLRSYGIRLPPGSLRQPGRGWVTLSATERRIAQLIAEGCSNPDIAAALFLSPKTVTTYVSRILVKLGARSRANISREAALHDESSQ